MFNNSLVSDSVNSGLDVSVKMVAFFFNVYKMT